MQDHSRICFLQGNAIQIGEIIEVHSGITILA